MKCVGTSTTNLVDYSLGPCSNTFDSELGCLSSDLECVQLEETTIESRTRACPEQMSGGNYLHSRKGSNSKVWQLWKKRESIEEWLTNTAQRRKQKRRTFQSTKEEDSSRVSSRRMNSRSLDVNPVITQLEQFHIPCVRCDNCQQVVASQDRDIRRRCTSEVRNFQQSGPFYPCATMYTNQQNLQHTIWLQQELFRQALTQQQQHNHSQATLPSSPTSTAVSSVKDEEEMVWKVKRRSDGSRYITRRPVRNKLLKERALKINEERRGITTDDDAMSDLKFGRYWPKEERKRHLERERDRKRREWVMRSKMSVVEERVEERDDFSLARERRNDGIDCGILEKKNARKKHKVVSDDQRSVHNSIARSFKGHNKTQGLLSVTTV
ncbi:uncharacterized protein LOC143256373 isoform X1 [Tachypleus tridentatus]|uniref:uncharacterized protein LOC143256373 isoform X1 n=1 Tax=Tachypleus tridentatus TaxID=6853 RepID=UPI003FD07B9F